jgi:4-hydroxy-tetrahydrodipicolinate synthase
MRFAGILPAVTTPFDADDEIDVAALKANVEALLEAGVHGFVANGTMGEAAGLNREERRTVIRAVVEQTSGRGPVIAGVSSGSARQSLEYARDAKELGVDAIMSLPPLGYRADPDEVIAFFTEIATIGLPIMAYNNPEASGVDLPPAMIVRIAQEVDGVVAIKECSGDARRLAALINADAGLEILVGGDDWALEGFCAGATGWVTGVGVVAPREVVELYDHCKAGELDAARAVYRRILPIARFDMTPKLVQYFKAAQDAVGLTGGPTRAPRLPLNQTELAELEIALSILRGPVHA